MVTSAVASTNILTRDGRIHKCIDSHGQEPINNPTHELFDTATYAPMDALTVPPTDALTVTHGRVDGHTHGRVDGPAHRHCVESQSGGGRICTGAGGLRAISKLCHSIWYVVEPQEAMDYMYTCCALSSNAQVVLAGGGH
ncbi:hypothetical protein FISHEDRAFT_73693 [Fistulina hepatica ATCC 64428]|uniref:Uncharacterized protein n=1 Tax=Fistulina hepatica ATCC 64428 TaxID=1128425 RepID=A0A0D7ABX5_9AGAR|nr:hypothetical protein FISHEDRAFT_73693 [Fistulina hepatica ATCC 64428]